MGFRLGYPLHQFFHLSSKFLILQILSTHQHSHGILKQIGIDSGAKPSFHLLPMSVDWRLVPRIRNPIRKRVHGVFGWLRQVQRQVLGKYVCCAVYADADDDSEFRKHKFPS